MNYLKAIFEKWECKHKWHIYASHSIGKDIKNPEIVVDTLICKKCGKIKKITL